jgi:uncharacterized glyoxalase superfamily protein PhnB
MADTTPAMPALCPYMLYEDVGAALGWLERAFGLRERTRQSGPDGKVAHAEMTLAAGDGAAAGDAAVILMGCPGPQYRNPKRLGGVTQYLYIRVADVDRQFQRAVQAGAVVLEEPADQPYGDRRCGLEDPEGHRWYFASSIVPAPRKA